MKTIWKYELSIIDEQLISMPAGAEILSAGVQANDVVVLWVMCDPEVVRAVRLISIYGTGFQLQKDTAKFVGTVIQQQYGLVWHIFDNGES